MNEFGFDPDNLPEDMPEDIKNAITQHQMNHDSISHELRAFFEEMNEDQLRIFKGILSMISYANNPQATATYYIGVVVALLSQKYDICLGCGKKHGDEFAEMVKKEPSVSMSEPEEKEERAWPDVIREVDESTLEDMTEYGVEFVFNDYPKVKCTGCNVIYQSLEDRMLRPPKLKGCHTCQANSGWGGPHHAE